MSYLIFPLYTFVYFVKVKYGNDFFSYAQVPCSAAQYGGGLDTRVSTIKLSRPVPLTGHWPGPLARWLVQRIRSRLFSIASVGCSLRRLKLHRLIGTEKIRTAAPEKTFLVL